MNRKVSPLLSERCKVTIGRLGNVTPGLSEVMAELFQLVILPW